MKAPTSAVLRTGTAVSSVRVDSYVSRRSLSVRAARLLVGFGSRFIWDSGIGVGF